MQPDADRDSPIVVTGAAGFLGSHVVTRLLAAGRRVRATVRDLDNAPKRAYLDELRARSPELLELFEADLMKPGSFDRCVDGAGAVIHTAASVRLTARDHRNIVEPSVEGTRNVVASMLAASVPRLVHTSSMAAVVRYKDARRGPFDEQDWNDESRPADDPYGFAKTRAERDLWELHAGRSEDSRFTLSVLCPSLILGPILAPHHRRASPAIVADLMAGQYPAWPPFHFNAVDVRDVAEAHVRALDQQLDARRFILNAGPLPMGELCRLLRTLRPDVGAPRWRLPKLVTWLTPLFEKRLSFVTVGKLLNGQVRLDSTRSRDELRLDYRDLESTIADCARSLSEHGFSAPAAPA